MKKIKDRLILGMISGLIGNQAKELTSSILINKYKFGKISGSKKAASIFMPKWKLIRQSTGTKLLGIVTDNIVAGVIGIIGVYILSYTGKDHHRIKAVGLSHFIWVYLFGYLSKLANLSIKTVGVKTNLNALISHTIYGLVTSELIVRLGDERLFRRNPKYLDSEKTVNNDDTSKCSK